MTSEIPNEIIEKLKAFVNKCNSHRYQYAIVVKNQGKFEIHERTSEPCYGGLRKYKSTHGEKATQDEHKPGDLDYPFPVGEPVGVAFPFDRERFAIPASKEIIDYMWGPESPWIKGFGSVDNLIPTFDAKGVQNGFIINTGDIDPTVMVNLAKITKVYVPIAIQKFSTLRKEGLTPFEALSCCLFNGMTHFDGHQPTYSTYMLSATPSLKMFKEGKVNDLSKGTWRQGFDYSRRYIQDLFKRTNDNEADFFTLMNNRAKAAPIKNAKEYAEVARENIKKCLS